MADEQTASENSGQAAGRMDLTERRLWLGAQTAALIFIAIAILAVGHRRHQRVRGMAAGHTGWMMQNPMVGPPPWAGPREYYWRGWAPPPWSGMPGGPYGPDERQPSQSAPGPRG
jgi:hypothetical protein